MIHLHFETCGEGYPLLLLHGNGEDLTFFNKQIKAFSAQYQVYAIDTRGHGKSPRGEGTFSIRRFAEDLYDFMQWQGIEKAHILGFSDGANIAMYFALAHPEKIGKLILNGGNLYPSGLKAYFNLPCQIGYRLLKLLPGKSGEVQHFYELLALMALEPQIAPQALGSINVPTLVLAGSRDIVKFEHTRLIAKSLPCAKIKILEGGHCLATSCPNAYNQVILDFLKQS